MTGKSLNQSLNPAKPLKTEDMTLALMIESSLPIIGFVLLIILLG